MHFKEHIHGNVCNKCNFLVYLVGGRNNMYCVSVSVLLVGLFLVLLHQGDTCNEAVCGSVVSKCLLTQSCKCDLENCSCCKECFTCLSYLYSECCSCVGELSLFTYLINKARVNSFLFLRYVPKTE